MVTPDLDGVTDQAGLMDRAARALDLPEWFGRNRDALAGSLAGLGVWPSGCAGRGLLLVVRGRRPYARRNARERALAEEVFAQAVDRTPEPSVALAPRAPRPLGRRVPRVSLGRSSEPPPDRPGRFSRAGHHGSHGTMKYVLFPLAGRSGGHL
ncbi:barstar family protein [Streptomyces sp. NPDC003401]